MPRLFCLLLLCTALVAGASAQEMELPQAAVKDEAALAQALPGLATRALAIYREPDRRRYLDTLFRLQLVAGRYAEAVETLRSLAKLQSLTDPSPAPSLLPFELLAKASARQRAGGLTFDRAFRQEFRRLFARLDDQRAEAALSALTGDLNRLREDFRAAVEKQKGRDAIALADALDLLAKYQTFRTLQLTSPLSSDLSAEDDARRYLSDRDLLIRTPDGAQLAAIVVRPKSAKRRLPAILLFTIYANEARSFADARRAAARGYASVVAYTRGKGRSPDEPVPYERDGEDARAVIDWISRQPWSDGRVGMYGGSYSGFTQWAALKQPHPALKTIVPYVAIIPGLGLPMENNIFLNANYGWAFYVTNNKYLDDKTYFDPQRWQSMQNKWYATGKPYRQIDSIDGTPNRWLQRWLEHPAYDEYWRRMVPYRSDFSAINIPVLNISGYFDDAQISSLHYLREHYRYNPNAEHYLLIGPYEHFWTQRSQKPMSWRGYNLDPVAQMDTPEITFQWMDYVLRGGRRPALLKDKINYQVMGANVWKHAPSLEKMSNQTLTLYLTDEKLHLTDEKTGDRYRLSKEKPSRSGSLSQAVDLADRETTNNDYYPRLIVGKTPDLSNGFSFISEPFDEPFEISGFLTGEIKAAINKKDMDVGVVLYELMPDGKLFQLSYFLGRASYAEDMSVRRLLTPGRIASIPFDRSRMVSRRLARGSRLLVTLNVNKHAFAQINYGTGKDVSDEDINDAATPLQIKWYNDSYVKIPVWK